MSFFGFEDGSCRLWGPPAHLQSAGRPGGRDVHTGMMVGGLKDFERHGFAMDLKGMFCFFLYLFWFCYDFFVIYFES